MTLHFSGGANVVRSLGDINRAGERFAENFAGGVADIQQYRAFRLRCLKNTLAVFDNAKIPADALFVVRLKRLMSIYRKLTRTGHNFKLGTLDDIIGIRIICLSYNAALSAGDSIGQLPEIQATKNYLTGEHYTGTGYRAIHHIIKIPQVLSAEKTITVRFEVQVRSYLQQMFAVWVEARGENAKLGRDGQSPKTFPDLSARIKQWEEKHPEQNPIAFSHSAKNILISVCMKQRDGEVRHISCGDDIEYAVEILNHYENNDLVQDGSVLLLAGKAGNEKSLLNQLHLTHPIYTLGRAYPPDVWLPK